MANEITPEFLTAEDAETVETYDEWQIGEHTMTASNRDTRELRIKYSSDPVPTETVDLEQRIENGEEAPTVLITGDEEEFAAIKQACIGIYHAVAGVNVYPGHELVCCPECGYEDAVDNVVFPPRPPFNDCDTENDE